MPSKDPSEAFKKNLETFQKDTKVQQQLHKDLGAFLIQATDSNMDPKPTVAYRNGWLAGFMFAHGTPVASQEDDNEEEDDNHSSAPPGPEGPSIGIA